MKRLRLSAFGLRDLVLQWLMEPHDPSIRYHTLVDLLHYSPERREAVDARNRIPRYSLFRRIMAAQTKAGYWPRKDTCNGPRFTGALWMLMLLGEMAAVPDARIKNECERLLRLHQTENGAFSYMSKLRKKKLYDDACATGNMARTLLVLGYEKDPRVRKAIDWLLGAQLDDGGWNCDYPAFQGVRVRHSSFMSTITALWAFSEIPKGARTRRIKSSIGRAAEFLLMHHLYKADHHEWMPMNRAFTDLHFPMYYFYDALHGLRVLTKLGYGDDSRVRDAVHLVLSKRRPDGKWVLESDWFNQPTASTRWLMPKRGTRSAEPVDPWGNSLKGWAHFEVERVGKPSKWITLNCYRALALTGDLKIRQ